MNRTFWSKKIFTLAKLCFLENQILNSTLRLWK